MCDLYGIFGHTCTIFFIFLHVRNHHLYESVSSKRYLLACALIVDSDQSADQTIRFALCGHQGSNLSSDGKLRLKADSEDVQTDLSLRCLQKPMCTLSNYQYDSGLVSIIIMFRTSDMTAMRYS